MLRRSLEKGQPTKLSGTDIAVESSAVSRKDRIEPMPAEDITPLPNDPVSPKTEVCCSFCRQPSNGSRPLVESPDQTAYVCGDCALKSAYAVFAHKQTLAYKLVMGLIPLVIFFALGAALGAYFLDPEFAMETHIGLGLIVLGFMTCQVLNFWWPNDDLLPRRPWF